MTRGFGLTFLFALVAGACTPRPEAVTEQSCPPCECRCNGESSGGATPADSGGAANLNDPGSPANPVDPDGSAPLVSPFPASGAGSLADPVGAAVDPGVPVVAGGRAPDGRDIGELVGDASRKMMHDDGKGCLADLDLAAKLDPKLAPRLEATRGQCEMLVGLCQEGKARVARWYETESNMHPERAMITAESLASMRCRGGNSSDRDRLLRAYFELSQGAYVEPFAPERCEEHLATARALIPKVKPRDVDDGQITGGAQALFHTAAQCFAKAGECKRARVVYRELFPPESLRSIGDAATRERIVRESFDSSIERCKGKI